ncbi:hypothetical protein FHR81_003104 [Actinoalloteichus hoggarensis]|uniref:hypothetical protein n=1 Tax=Actinoalloteichus hoggarensis TaxID=1470176 RepID=UPI0012FDD191|nr:hypothetical protein [Actinoalloteichus hoggarensis]MBB5922052.1 hypothetical protein [Actinoalloteichus hoggarensis]
MPISLPSCDPHFDFQVTLTVGFTVAAIGVRPANPQAVALAGLSSRAEEISRRRSLTEAQRLRGELDIGLAQALRVADTGVEAWGFCAEIEVDPDLLAAVAGRQQARRRAAVGEWEEAERRSRESRMRTLITDPLQATAWWYAGHQDQPKELAEVAKAFQQVSELVTPARPEVAETAGGLVDELVQTAGPDIGFHVRSTLRRIFAGYHRDDLCARLDALPVTED